MAGDAPASLAEHPAAAPEAILALHTADGPGRWLSVVGLGEDGLAGLSPAARAAIEAAELVFGGSRHLVLAAAAIRGAAHHWPTPFDVAGVTAARGRRVAVLASGDPFFTASARSWPGRFLLRRCRFSPPRRRSRSPPPASAGPSRRWPRSPSTAGPSISWRPHLQPGRRLIVLTSDRDGPTSLARLMTESGFGPSRLTVLEALGGPHERVRATSAVAFALADIADLNVVGIEVVATAGARIIARTAGLPDDLFEHDGQITKREIRAITLAALGPRRGEILWDIGAGRLDRNRMDARRSEPDGDRRRTPRRPGRPHRPQCERVRRFGPRGRSGRGARGPRRARRAGRRLRRWRGEPVRRSRRGDRGAEVGWPAPSSTR